MRTAQSRLQRLFLERGVVNPALHKEIMETHDLWKARVYAYADTIQGIGVDPYRTKQGQAKDSKTEKEKQISALDTAKQIFTQATQRKITDLEAETTNALVTASGLTRTLDSNEKLVEVLLQERTCNRALRAQENAIKAHQRDLEGRRIRGEAISDGDRVPPDVIAQLYRESCPAIVAKSDRVVDKVAAEEARLIVRALEAGPFPLVDADTIAKGTELKLQVLCPTQLQALSDAQLKAEAMDIIFNEARNAIENPSRISRPVDPYHVPVSDADRMAAAAA